MTCDECSGMECALCVPLVLPCGLQRGRQSPARHTIFIPSSSRLTSRAFMVPLLRFAAFVDNRLIVRQFLGLRGIGLKQVRRLEDQVQGPPVPRPDFLVGAEPVE